jgi:alcohol dehydrogenase (cytochrome c)
VDASSREPHNWLNHHGDLGGQRFSKLTQIHRRNVSGLKVAWTLALGGHDGGGQFAQSGFEATPIVEDGFMYLVDGWGVVTRIDMRKGAGKIQWRMDPKTDKDFSASVQCCGVNNRGVALWGDKVVSHTLDGRLVATYKATGEIAWQRNVADPAIAEVITAAPLIVKNLAITGVAGGEYGIRGWVAATDLATGKEVWRTHTVPAPGEKGHETWADDHGAWKTGGGATWVTGTFDPKSNMIFWGTGNPGPDWDPEYRPGDNLYTDSVIAMDADTGRIAWHFQHTPNDPYDYDSVSENTVVDATILGKSRKAVLHANRNGFVYALDRADGKFLWGTQFVDSLNWTPGLDPLTGRPKSYDPTRKVQAYSGGTAPSRTNKAAQLLCPSHVGGKNWAPSVYHPELNRYYIPAFEGCNQLNNEVVKVGDYKPREWFTGGGPKQPQPIKGSVVSVDVATGKVLGKYRTEYPMLGGLLATRDLVFMGRPEGAAVALDANSLEEVWSFSTGGGINAPPMTFAVDGKQYVAFVVALGGVWPKWFLEATPGLEKVQTANMLFVFSL